MNRKLKTPAIARLEVIFNVWKQGFTHVKNVPINTLLFLFLLAVVQPIWHGYQFGVSDHSIQFSIMNRIMDETLYPDDPMLDTAKGYVSFFPRFMVILIKIVGKGNMEALYFALHVLSYFFYFTMFYYISLLLFDKISATLCVILISTSKIVLGGSSIHFTGLYPSFFTLPLVLLAIYFFLKERYSIAYAIIGTSLNLHVLAAGYTFCMFLCYSLLCVIRANVSTGASSKIAALKGLAKYLGIFFLCASPALIWILSTHGTMSDEWVRLLRVRSSHHSFPFSWAKSHYVNYLLFLSAGALSLLYAPRTNFHRKILAFALAVGIMCIAGVIFAEYYPVKFVLRGQLFRSTNFLTIFCVMYISNYLRCSWKNTILHKVAVIIIFMVLFFSSYFNLLILGLILCLLADNVLAVTSTALPATEKATDRLFISEPEGQRLSQRVWMVLFVLMAILVRNFAPHDSFPSSLNLNGIASLLKTFFENRLLLFIICAAIMLRSIVALNSRSSEVYPNEIALFLATANLKNILQKLAMLLIAILLVVYVVPSAYRRFHPENRYSEGWRNVQVWAKENTEKTALFLTPPYMTGFRIFSQRPIVGEWKDGTQQYFDADYSYEWWRRMQDMKSDRGGRNFDNLGKAQYVELAGKYDANYLVVPSSISLDLPKEYDNSQYAIYRFE